MKNILPGRLGNVNTTRLSFRLSDPHNLHQPIIYVSFNQQKGVSLRTKMPRFQYIKCILTSSPYLLSHYLFPCFQGPCVVSATIYHLGRPELRLPELFNSVLSVVDPWPCRLLGQRGQNRCSNNSRISFLLLDI